MFNHVIYHMFCPGRAANDCPDVRWKFNGKTFRISKKWITWYVNDPWCQHVYCNPIVCSNPCPSPCSCCYNCWSYSLHGMAASSSPSTWSKKEIVNGQNLAPKMTQIRIQKLTHFLAKTGKSGTSTSQMFVNPRDYARYISLRVHQTKIHNIQDELVVWRGGSGVGAGTLSPVFSTGTLARPGPSPSGGRSAGLLVVTLTPASLFTSKIV